VAPRKPPRATVSTPKRVAWLERHLSRGMRATALVHKAQEEWGIAESMVWTLIREIKERWLEESKANRETARAEVCSQVEHLIETAYADGDLKTVKSALTLKAELHGLRLKAVVNATDEAAALSIPRFLADPREGE